MGELLVKVLSIVVPAYNSQAFLDKGIPSLLQEEILDELDIIIVNDGSTDATEEIAKRYCDAYPQSVRLITQENRGHGGALNTGCAAAVGKYVKVIDADDWVQTAVLPKFVKKLRDCTSDVVLSHYHTVNISTGRTDCEKMYPETFDRSYSLDEIMGHWKDYHRCLTFHGITYRTDFYQSRGHQLLEKVFYEDNEFALIPCCYAETITPFDLFVYEYRIGDVTQSISTSNQVKRLPHMQAVILRMLQVHNTLPEGAAKRYSAMKTQAVVSQYLTAALLAAPDRKEGRLLAAREMAVCSEMAPDIYGMLRRKYQVYRLLHILHISKNSWDKFVRSKLCNFLRKRRNA